MSDARPSGVDAENRPDDESGSDSSWSFLELVALALTTVAVVGTCVAGALILFTFLQLRSVYEPFPPTRPYRVEVFIDGARSVAQSGYSVRASPAIGFSGMLDSPSVQVFQLDAATGTVEVEVISFVTERALRPALRCRITDVTTNLVVAEFVNGPGSLTATCQA